MNIQRFLDVLPDAPEWEDLPLPETDDTDAKKDAPRDSFKSFQDKAAYTLYGTCWRVTRRPQCFATPCAASIRCSKSLAKLATIERRRKSCRR